MGDTMLHGVLRMPPELWDENPFDQQQRHSRYLEASDLIRALKAENEALKQLIEDHNNEVIGACFAQKKAGRCDGYVTRGRSCPDCYADWIIDTARQKGE